MAVARASVVGIDDKQAGCFVILQCSRYDESFGDSQEKLPEDYCRILVNDGLTHGHGCNAYISLCATGSSRHAALAPLDARLVLEARPAEGHHAFNNTTAVSSMGTNIVEREGGAAGASRLLAAGLCGIGRKGAWLQLSAQC